MSKSNIVLLVGSILILSGVGYFFYQKSKNKSTPILTVQQIFDQLYAKGAYRKKIDATAEKWTIDDLPFLNVWLDAANKGNSTFTFNNVVYNTLGGSKK
jgi:hypothetical protein